MTDEQLRNETPEPSPPEEIAPAPRPRPSPTTGPRERKVGAHRSSGVRAEPVATTEPAATTEPTATAAATELATVPASAGRVPRGRMQRWVESGAGGSRRAGVIAVVAGVLALVVGVALVVVLLRRGDSASPSSADAAGSTMAEVTDVNRAQGFVAGATSDVAAVTSYSYRTLSSDLQNGEAVTTGAYRTRFHDAITGSLGATARRLRRTQSFDLAAAGIGQISDDGNEAHVLIFGTQSVQDDTTGGNTHQSLVTLDATVVRTGDTYRISGLAVGGNAGLPPGTTGLSEAAEAAREEIADLLTTRRAHVRTDYRAAVSLAVDPLRSQLGAQAASVRSAVTKGKYNLTGEVTAVGVQSAAGNSVTMLVAATGTKTTSTGKASLVTDGRYRVTVVRVKGKWYVSEVDPVAVS